MMIKETIKNLSGHTLIYSLAWVASSAAGILLLPIYTRYLSRAEYGILEILDYTNIIISIIVIAGLNMAIPRFYNDADNLEERRKVLSTATFFVIIFGGVCSIVGYSFHSMLAQVILGESSYGHLIKLNVILLYLQLMVNISVVSFIAQKKSQSYMIFMFLRLFIGIVTNLYFIVGLKFGVVGMLYGNIFSNGIVAIAITISNVNQNGWRVSLPILTKMVRFGLPLIPATLLATIMHNADRFLIRYYGNLDDVGIYSIGYKFPFMLNALIMQSFNFIWTGATIYEISKESDAAYQYGRITTYVIGLFLFAQLSLSIFAPTIMKLLTHENFFAARQVIPLVALGLCFHAFYFFFSIGSLISKKTWIVNLAYFPAAVVSIAGNMILLPKYGYMAAAWITLFTYFVFAIILFFVCRGLIKISYEYKRLSTIFITALCVGATAMLIQFENLWVEIIKEVGLILVFLMVLVLTRWFTKGEIQIVRDRFLIICRLMNTKWRKYGATIF